MQESHAPPITIELTGGLGNQLFQLSAAVVISQRTSRQFKLDTLNLTLSALPGVQRRRLHIGDLLKSDEVLSARKSLYQRFVAPRSMYLCEKGPVDDLIARISDSTLRLFGYFQRFQVAEGAYQDVIARLKLSSLANVILRSNSEARIAIHMRRGDYLNVKTQNYHGLIDQAYFMDAVRYISSVTGISSVIVVSDSPLEASKLLLGPLTSEGFSVIPYSQQSEWNDLGVLANSAAIVMSNSSFSWWGAYFAYKQHNAFVVAPNPWFASNNGVESILLAKEWHQIQSNLGRKSL